jgi:hypothetical protein
LVRQQGAGNTLSAAFSAGHGPIRTDADKIGAAHSFCKGVFVPLLFMVNEALETDLLKRASRYALRLSVLCNAVAG